MEGHSTILHHENKSSIQKLNEVNYFTWKQQIEMVLIREDLWDLIEKPTPLVPDDRWLKRDRLAKATMGLTIEARLLVDIKHAKTAKETWLKLERVYQQDTLGTRLALLRKVVSSKFTIGDNMSTHLNGILEAASRLEDRGHPVNPETICASILGSLPKEFNSLVTAIEGRSNKDISVDYLREKILEESMKHTTDRNPHLHTKALQTGSHKNPNPHRGLTCFYCHKVGHIRHDCRLLKNHSPHKKFMKSKPRGTQEEGEKPKSNIMYSNSNPEEEEDELWPNWRDSTNTAKAMVATVQSRSTPPLTQWIIDSGASTHMVKDKTLLYNYKPCPENHTITTASGDNHPATFTGEYTVSILNSDQKEINIQLTNVLYTPDLTDNLLSVTQLAQQGYHLSFDRENCWIDIGTGKLLLASIENNLYIHKEPKLMNRPNMNNQSYLCKHIIHERLGHRQNKDIPIVATWLEGANKCTQDGLCDTCHITKMTNTPYYRSTRDRATQPFQILHLDLCGPIFPQTIGQNRYALNIIDDHSRFSTVYLLNNKQQAAERIKEYIEHNINVFKRRPIILRSDGGGEFMGRDLVQYLNNKGIKHKVSLAYSPQNNGTIERLNRTLTETTRALIHQAALPKYLWGEMMSTASYLNNRTKHQDLPKTPYELWYQKELNIEHLRTIGTKCYFRNNKPDKKKLDNRGIPGVLIGYGDSSSIYRIWDPKDTKIYLSRCVRFEPEKCPMEKKSTVFDYTLKETPTYTPIQSQDDELSTISIPEEQETRQSQRHTKGKPPNILTYGPSGPTCSTKDYYKKRTHEPELNLNEH